MSKSGINRFKSWIFLLSTKWIKSSSLSKVKNKALDPIAWGKHWDCCFTLAQDFERGHFLTWQMKGNVHRWMKNLKHFLFIFAHQASSFLGWKHKNSQLLYNLWVFKYFGNIHLVSKCMPKRSTETVRGLEDTLQFCSKHIFIGQ